MWPHRRQPTRLPRPWDSPGKNTGVGCHFLLQSLKVKSESEVAQSCPTPRDPMDCSLPGSSVHGIFQARVLEWVAIAFSEFCLSCRLIQRTTFDIYRFPLLLLLSRFSRVWLCVTPETAAHQAPHPWDSPGKNTGVGCHFLLQCMKVKSESEVAQSCPTHSNPMDCSLPGSSIHGFSRQEYWSGVPFPSLISSTTSFLFSW